MINDNQTTTRNTRTVIGPFTGVVRDTDDIINVDTILGAVNLTLQNISGSGMMLNPRTITINDVGLNAAVNNINIYPSGSDLVNSGIVVTISVNGANAKCEVANLTEWTITGIGVVSSGISGSGTVNRVAKFVTPTAVGDSIIFDNGVSIGINTLTPNASAILDLSSTTQGFLYPRMTTLQRNAIASPATSLIIFNLTTNRFEYYNGATWIAMDMNGIYGGAGTVPANTTATLTNNLAFVSTSGGINVQFGIGEDPLGFGEAGILNYVTMTPAANLEAYGGIKVVAGEPTWLHQVYNVAGDESGLFAGWSAVQSNSYAAVYHFESGTGLYTGFEANAFGEQLYSQRLALVTTTLTVKDRVLFASAEGGYIKATTYADLVTQLAIPTFYNANGSTPGARTITLGGTLQFNHGAAGVNGYVQTVSGGYFRNQTSVATNYFEYNNASSIMLFNTDTTTVTGVRVNNDGGVNPSSLVELFAGSNSVAYLNIGPTTDRFDFYVNNTAKYAGGILGGSGAFNGSWGFGTTPTAGAKVYIISENGQGFGTVIATSNLSPAEYILQVRDAANFTRFGVTATGVTLCDYRFIVGTNLGSISNPSTLLVKGADSSALTSNFAITDGSNNLLIQANNAGQLGINTTDFAGGIGGLTNKFAVRGNNGDLGNHTLSLFENSLNPTSNNGNYQRALTASIIKYGAFNTYQITADYNVADNQGVGAITEMYGSYNRLINSGAANITNFYSVYADKQIQAGNITIASSFTADTSAYTGGVIDNLFGLYVKTPVNSGATVALTAGVWIENNTAGTENYSIVSATNNTVTFGSTAPNADSLLYLESITKAPLMLKPMTAVQASAITPADGMVLYVSSTNGTFTVVGFWGYENALWVKL
jgi:hypothetical protein